MEGEKSSLLGRPLARAHTRRATCRNQPPLQKRGLGIRLSGDRCDLPYQGPSIMVHRRHTTTNSLLRQRARIILHTTTRTNPPGMGSRTERRMTTVGEPPAPYEEESISRKERHRLDYDLHNENVYSYASQSPHPNSSLRQTFGGGQGLVVPCRRAGPPVRAPAN